MYRTLRDHGVNIINKDQGSSNHWLNILVSVAPFALLLGSLVLPAPPDAVRRQQGNELR